MGRIDDGGEPIKKAEKSPPPKSDVTTVLGTPPRSNSLVTGWLVVWSGEGRGEAHRLSYGRNKVGRASECDVVLDYGDSSISSEGKVSVTFNPTKGEFIIEDFGARNPVSVNGETVYQHRELFDNDVIQIGKTELIFKPFCTADRRWE